MQKFLKTVLLTAVIFGGLWVLAYRDEIKEQGGIAEFTKNRLASSGPIFDADERPESRNGAGTYQSSSQSAGGQGPFQTAGYASNPAGRPVAPPTDRIRIATFKLSPEATHANNMQSAALVADVCQRFDLIAFQEIDGLGMGWLDDLAGEIFRQSNGRLRYASVSDHHRVSRDAMRYAFMYNTQTLELDFQQSYTVADPDHLLEREPLVGWFRTKLADPNDAFTFTAVNVQLKAVQTGDELAHLGELFRAIRNDGRGEDDIIIAGDFNVGDRGLQTVQRRNGLTWVVSNTPTNTLGDAQYDNLVFNQTATVEFTGRGGVVDFLKAYNLTMADAVSISRHMPVWAEFTVTEN